MCVKLTKVVCFTMKAHRMNMHYLTREAVKLVLNEGSDLEDISNSGSEENLVEIGKAFVPVDLETDSSDSNNGIFIFSFGIQATSRIKLLFYTVWIVPALRLRQRRCVITMDCLSNKYTSKAF